MLRCNGRRCRALLEQVYGLVGASVELCWRKYAVLLAHVWKMGWDLRQRNTYIGILWRRYPRKNLTCTKEYYHLHQGVPPPAPRSTTTCTKKYHHLHQEVSPPEPDSTFVQIGQSGCSCTLEERTKYLSIYEVDLLTARRNAQISGFGRRCVHKMIT